MPLPGRLDKHGSPRILFLTTSVLALRYLFAGQVSFLKSSGFEVATATSPEDGLSLEDASGAYPDNPVPLRRNFSPLRDLIALAQLTGLMMRLRPHVVHTHTPKAGLLGMIAAALAGVRIRIYTINGLVLSTRRGFQRLLLRLSEMVACRLAHRVLCVSPSLRAEVVALGLCPDEKATVLGHGSSHGVNLERFSPAKRKPEARAKVRAAWGMPDRAMVIGFVGRLVRDKGIEVLAEAWHLLAADFANLSLFLCGGFEPHDPVPRHVVSALQQDPRVHITGGFVDDMPAVYSAIDICVLPTFREGFPNVPLECGAMEIPVVATRVTGCVDAVVDGETGLLVPPGDPCALAAAVRRLILDPDLRHRLGRQARAFVASRFSEEHVHRLLVEEYCRLLSSAGLPVPRPAEHPVECC